MRKTFPSFVSAFVVMITMMISEALADTWNGDWNSSFGQLRLLQNGDRLFGDYQDRGVIEGKISPDGREARAFFIYQDGRWGTVQWRIAGDRLSGTWNWSTNGLPEAKGSNTWTATREAARTSPLRFADQTRSRFPADDAINQEPYLTWLRFGYPPQPSPSSGPDPVAELSNWYGGYDLTNIDPAFDIGIDAIHYSGSNAVAVDFSIFVNPDGTCPQVMHNEFCDELRALADTRGYVEVSATGATIINRGNVGETLEATFRLPGDRFDRALRIRREATYFSASIHHFERGYDFGGYAQGRSHFCEQTRCAADLFDDLRTNPRSYLGNVDRGAILRMINLPDRIAASHQSTRPAPQQPSTGQGQGPSGGARTLFSDAYTILDETSENLGEVVFSPNGGQLAASGRLRNFFEISEDHETVFTLIQQTDQAVAFELTVYAGQSGESKQGRLMVELPSYARNNPRGTLMVADEIFLVELVRPIPGTDTSELGDTPAIGIYSTSYRLRDVPLDRAMQLRSGPDRSTGVVGTIAPQSTGLQMLGCAREINSQLFEAAGLNERLLLLSSTWCQITNYEISGWVPGIYLVPEN